MWSIGGNTMKVIFEPTEDEIKTLEEQLGLTIKSEDDVIDAIHLLLKIIKD